MIYQERFLKLVDNLKYMPKSIFIKGDIGSEFDEAIDSICSKFNLLKFDLDKYSETEYSTILTNVAVPTLFTINVDTLTELKQNSLYTS
mgnify:CR=1 FL=1